MSPCYFAVSLLFRCFGAWGVCAARWISSETPSLPPSGNAHRNRSYGYVQLAVCVDFGCPTTL
eukprot:804764-Amphidinium_carterae.1